MSPRVSVLLTSYNHLPYLQLAVECLRAQTFREFEVLVLDDGSTDGSREWLAAQPDLTCYFHPKNLGTYGNLNFGLERAQGEFVAVFNDDDLWAPEKLAEQVAVFEGEPGVGLVHTSGWFIGPDGERVDGAPLGFVWPKTSNRFALPELIHFNRLITSSAMFRRSLVEQVGPFDPSFYGCGDWHMWLRMAVVTGVTHVDQPLTFYRVHPENACRDTEKMDEDSRRIRDWLTEVSVSWPEEILKNPEVDAALAHNLACRGTAMVWLGRAAEGRGLYWQSWRKNPRRFKNLLRIAASFLPQRAFRRLG